MLKGLKRQAGILAVTLLSCTGGVAADIPAKTPTLEPVPVPRSWEFTFTPYAWIVIDKGTLSLGSRSAPIDTNLFKLLDDSDHLYAWMSYQEMRYGPLALYANVFWSKIGASNTRTGYWEIGDFINVEAVANASIWATMAIVEPGITYEFSQWNSGWGNTALDVVGGGRYWYLKSEIDLTVTGTVSIPALGLSRTRTGFASASKVIDWIDPFVGLRMRHKFAPGHDLVLQGDVGGFGVGSDFTWQALAAYNFEWNFAGYKLNPYLGYRAISVDYEEGSGRRRIGLDFVQHGPVAGLTFKW